MTYTATFTLALGTSQTGIADLRAQIVDTTGANTGAAVSTGFVEIGQGFYIWNYASIPDDHRGAVKFYSLAASSVFLAAASINPEELEYTDGKISTAQTDLDTITGADGVNLLSATQASIDAIETDTSTTIPGTITTIDTNVDAILVDTATTIPATIATVDSNVDAILVDTSTTIPATIATAQADLDTITGADGVNLLSATQASVDAIETDTGTTIPAQITSVHGTTDGLITTVDTVVDAILVDTATTIPATITTAQNDLDIITGTGGATLETATQASIDAIEVDTGTTLPALISGIDASGVAAAVWEILTSTLTTTGSIGKLLVDKMALLSGPISTSATSSADITITRAVTAGEAITVTVPGTWHECYFTIKNDQRADLDSESIVQIKVTDGGDSGDGVLYLNGSESATILAYGSLVVNASDVTFTLSDDATALLADCKGANYDVKFINTSTSVSTLAATGTANINLTPTRTV